MEPFVWQRQGTGSPYGGVSHTQILKKFREIWSPPLPGSSCTPQGSACHLPVPKAVPSMGQPISSMARTHSSWNFQGSRSSGSGRAGMATAASQQRRRDGAAAAAGSSGMMDGVKWSTRKDKHSKPGWLCPAGTQWTTRSAGSPISCPIREQMEQQHPTELRHFHLLQPENSGGARESSLQLPSQRPRRIFQGREFPGLRGQRDLFGAAFKSQRCLKKEQLRAFPGLPGSPSSNSRDFMEMPKGRRAGAGFRELEWGDNPQGMAG